MFLSAKPTQAQRRPSIPDLVEDQVELSSKGCSRIGKQGAAEILAAEVGERAGTIAWEIFTGVGSRVRRVYL